MANIQILPYAQQAAAIDRQKRLSQLLQQQGAEPIEQQTAGGFVVPTSPWQTLAKVIQAGAGGYMERKAAEREAALKKQTQEEAQKSVQDLITAMGPQKAWESKEAAPVETRPYEYKDFQNEADYEAYRNNPEFGQPNMVKPTQFNDITGEYEPVREWKEITKPGLSRNEALARILQMQTSENPYTAQMAPALTALLPKEIEANIGAIDPTKYTPESVETYKTTGKYGDLRQIIEPIKQANLQRFTKEVVDSKGYTYTQGYTFDPVSGKETPVGEKYLSSIPTPKSSSDAVEAGAKLRTEYNNHPDVKNYNIVSSAYENILNNQETGAGDIALVFNYMKMLDPTSAVREGEYATAQNSGSLPQSVLNIYNRAISGERLNAEQRNNFIAQAKSQYDTAARREQSVREGIEQIGQQTGVNPRLYRTSEPRRRSNDLPDGFVVQPQG